MVTMRVVLVVFMALGTARAQWEILPSGSTADLRGVDAVGNGVAWASGTQGTILRTTDDGKSWQRCATPAGAEGLDFRGVQAFDATAIVMSSGKGDLSRLYKTVDGCKSWKLLFTNPDADGFWDAFWINMDRGEGMLVGDPVKGRLAIFGSTDDGISWKRDASRSLSVSGSSLSVFAASNSSLARADRGEGDTRGPGVDFFPGFVTGGTGGAFLVERWEGPLRRKVPDRAWKIPDWNRHGMPLASGSESTGAFAIALRYTGSPCSDCGFGMYWHLVAVGGDYSHPDQATGTAAYSTEDGGWTWTAATTQPHGYRSAVAYDAVSKAWITVGPNGTDVSTDDGRNWRPLRPDPALHDPPDADQHWNALSLPFVVGPHGRIGKLRPEALKLTAPRTIPPGAKP
jgi:photosystem II stability/assembly factor-like uncharacterized protein